MSQSSASCARQSKYLRRKTLFALLFLRYIKSMVRWCLGKKKAKKKMTNIPSSQSVCPIYLSMVIQPLLLLTIITFYAYLHNPSSLILRQYSIKIVSEAWNEKICSTENICSTEKNFFSVSFLENDRKLQKRSPAKRKFVHLKLYSSSSTY